MFGFYELYIPRFLQPKSHTIKQGSLFSAFIFGIMSGSFASPCLSPGLLLLLSICATMGHKLYSFLLLFFFGFGLGLPLLIIGTFTSSLTLLPRAGMWMVEIKKIFGFLLLGMCLFYASTFITPVTTLFIITFALIITGLYYIAASVSPQSKALHRFKYIVGTLCIILSFISAAETYKVYSFQQQEFWLTDYQEARQIALQNNKKMILDFGATWCTLCKKMDTVIFHNPHFQPILQQFVLVKIDCTNAQNQQCHYLTDKFSIKGYPAIHIVEPEQETSIYSAGAELLDKKSNDFIALLESYR
jgi:thioredoxin:protein disulfide reductase